MAWTISSSSMRMSGAICEIIVGTHSLVSTPSTTLLPIVAWLGIVRSGVPRIHPIIRPQLLAEAAIFHSHLLCR